MQQTRGFHKERLSEHMGALSEISDKPAKPLEPSFVGVYWGKPMPSFRRLSDTLLQKVLR